MFDKGIKAACRFLERKGYQIVDTYWEKKSIGRLDIVAWDDIGNIHFVDVTVTENGFEDGHTKRNVWELAASCWLADNHDEISELSDFEIHFDRIDMNVVADDKAMLRFHTNVFN